MLQRVGVADSSVSRENNETYKSVPWNDMAQKATEAYTKEQLETDLDNLYQTVYPSLKASNPTRFDEYFKRTMDALGIQSEITDGKVHLVDITSLPANVGADIDMEAFAKQTATEVVAATPTEPATPRESLQQVAGTPTETPAAPAAGSTPTETLGSNISSPEVATAEANVVPTEPTSLPEAQKPVEVLPEDVEDRVKFILNNSKESNAAVDLTTGELMDYLKTHLEMAAGTRITDGKIEIDGNSVNLTDMKAKSVFGDIHFNGKMVTDPEKGLTVDMSTVHYDLPLLMKLFEGTIKNQLGHFDKTMFHHMAQRLPKSWKADRIDIVGEKVELKFVKQPPQK